MGIEPMSESIFTGISPSAVSDLRFALLTAFFCGDDGIITQRELKFAFEYFFICVTEILFFTLAFDLMYKYEKRGIKD